jgi:hypothetical protein
MKIGLSFSRCLRDIVEARVQFEDVLLIIARTDFNPHDDMQWEEIWSGYRYRGGWSKPEWADAEPGTDDDEVNAMYRNVAVQLYDAGKIHQPRQFGANPQRMPYYWLDTVVPEDELKQHPAVQEAWDRYQVIAGLAR